MSNKENKEKKVKPTLEDSPSDIPNVANKDISLNTDEENPSGTPCICKEKRNIQCVLHGG